MQVTDEQRGELVRLIHEKGFSIARASKDTQIPYDNAKAINRTYMREKRVHKINQRGGPHATEAINIARKEVVAINIVQK